jgi:hypothetical protein
VGGPGSSKGLTHLQVEGEASAPQVTVCNYQEKYNKEILDPWFY